jgi:hypothetical protein
VWVTVPLPNSLPSVVTLTGTGTESGATTTHPIPMGNDQPEPVYIDAVATGGWSQLLIGYGPNHVWAPKLDPAVGQQNVVVRVRAIGNVDWNEFWLRPQSHETNMVRIGDYAPTAPGSGWFDVTIPLSAFPTGSFTDISELAIYHRTQAGYGHIQIAQILFTGARERFEWFGAGHIGTIEADPNRGQIAASVVREQPSGIVTITPANPGYRQYEPQTFTITYTNPTAVVQHPVINIELPDQVVHTSNTTTSGSYIPWPGRRHEWHAGTVAAGETVQLVVQLFPLGTARTLPITVTTAGANVATTTVTLKHRAN